MAKHKMQFDVLINRALFSPFSFKYSTNKIITVEYETDADVGTREDYIAGEKELEKYMASINEYNWSIVYWHYIR